MLFPPPQGTVVLPVFAGFNSFAVWPVKEAVSVLVLLLYHNVLYLKGSSNYGLLSKETVYSPVDTGDKVALPFYPGCLYGAYRGKEDQEVGIHFIDENIYLSF